MFYIMLILAILLAIAGLALIGNWQIILGIALVVAADKLGGVAVRGLK